MLGGLGLGAVVSSVAAAPQVPITITGDGIVQVVLKGAASTATRVLKVKVLYTID